MASAQALSDCLRAGGVEALRTHLLQAPPALPLSPSKGDFDLNPAMPRVVARQALAPAAVLVPLVARTEFNVLFTRRAGHLLRHAGQISFPGGRWEEGDATLIDTALRETHEETGIGAEFISVAGFLDPYETGTGYAILPVVAVLREGFVLQPDDNEVAEIFEVPLHFLLEPGNRQRRSGEWQGRSRVFYAFSHGDHDIWGATAGMMSNLVERLST